MKNSPTPPKAPRSAKVKDGSSNEELENEVHGSSKRKNVSGSKSKENGSHSVSKSNHKDKADKRSKVEDDSDEESYEVESIIDSRYMRGKHQFKIRWKGFGPNDDTWENEDNLDCPQLIADFQKESGETSKPAKKRSSLSKGAATESPPKKKKGTPSKKKAEEEDDDDDDTEWEVSKVLDSVELKDGTRNFLVRWKGYSSRHDSWEPEKNLNCLDLIQKYLEAEKNRDTVDRKVREERAQVNRYNPELTKRQSSRTSSKKSDGVWSEVRNTYQRLLDEESGSDSSRYNAEHIPRKDLVEIPCHHLHTKPHLESKAAWQSWASQCLLM